MHRPQVIIRLTTAVIMLLWNSELVCADESICFGAVNKAAQLVGTPTQPEKHPPYLQIPQEQYDALSKLIRSVRRGDSKEKITSGLSVTFSEHPIQAKGIGTPIRGYVIDVATYKEDRDFSNVHFDKSILFIFDANWRLACVESNDMKLNPKGFDNLLLSDE